MTGTQGIPASADSGQSWSDWAGIHQITADGHNIDLVPETTPVESWPAPWDRAAAAQHPNDTPYLLFQDGNYGGLVWLPPGSPQLGAPPVTAPVPVAAPPVDPRRVALDLLHRIPLPQVRIGENPSLGLVGLPAWFWGGGYDGHQFGDSASLPGVTVTVEVIGSRYEWSFGDGSTMTSTSLGKPYPATSDIQHTYEYSSLNNPQGFPVRLTIEFDAQYRVNGGPLQPLPPILRSYETGYRVQEMQSLLSGH